jgi:hypothetical protein
MILTRRGLIGGFASLLAAPAIVRVSSLMPVKAMPPSLYAGGITWIDAAYDEPLAVLRGVNGLIPWGDAAGGWR